MANILFRPIKANEAASAAELEKACLHTAWSESQIKSLPEYAVYIAAFSEEVLCGIASIYCIAGEGQIMNVAVSPQYRRKGIASGLMDAIINQAIERSCTNITLEVADNNDSAISLYKKCGFDAVGKRNGFYNGVDAIIMEKKL